MTTTTHPKMSPPLLDITLDRSDRTYRQNDLVKGSVVVTVYEEDLNFSDLVISIRSDDSTTSRRVLNREVTLTEGRLRKGETKFFFSLELAPYDENEELPETYHGVRLEIVYYVSARVRRKLFLINTDYVTKQLEFFVEIKPGTHMSRPLGPFDPYWEVTENHSKVNTVEDTSCLANRVSKKIFNYFYALRKRLCFSGVLKACLKFILISHLSKLLIT